MYTEFIFVSLRAAITVMVHVCEVRSVRYMVEEISKEIIGTYLYIDG
jgi:hypothetical protein